MVHMSATRGGDHKNSIAAQILKNDDRLVLRGSIKMLTKRGTIFRPVELRGIKHNEFELPVKSIQIYDRCFPTISLKRDA